MNGSSTATPTVAPQVTLPTVLRDLVSLTKPRLSALVVLTAGGGMWLAPGPLAFVDFLWTIVGTTLLVGAANAVNCWIERDVDRLMARTASRPLPARRLDPAWGVAVGVALAAVSLPMLYLAVNPLTAALGVVALLSYVLVYTPMKRRSPLAVFAGTVPGAMPTLMGWSAATGQVGGAGLALFATLAVWQLPHFLAISVFREREYALAGFRIASTVWGGRAVRIHAVVWAAALIPVSLLPWTLGAAGPIYAAIAFVAGAAYLFVAADGLRTDDPVRWARRLFFTSLVYVPALFLGVGVDGGR